MTFGDTLREILKEQNMTQQDLASRINTHRTTISEYVNNKRIPDSETFQHIFYILPYSSLADAYSRLTDSQLEDISSSPFTTREIVIRNNKEENKLIAHALVYVVAAFEEEGLQALAPNDYWSYKILVEKYKPYLNG